MLSLFAYFLSLTALYSFDCAYRVKSFIFPVLRTESLRSSLTPLRTLHTQLLNAVKPLLVTSCFRTFLSAFEEFLALRIEVLNKLFIAFLRVQSVHMHAHTVQIRPRLNFFSISRIRLQSIKNPRLPPVCLLRWVSAARVFLILSPCS